jgi:hypothetical protein
MVDDHGVGQAGPVEVALDPGREDGLRTVVGDADDLERDQGAKISFSLQALIAARPRNSRPASFTTAESLKSAMKAAASWSLIDRT